MAFEFRIEDTIAEIHFDDGKANAYRTQWFHAFSAELDRAIKEGARAIMIRGREGIFSGGLDTKWLPTLDGNELGELIRAFGTTMLKVWTLKVPTVAAVTGHAIAGGCILAAACDHRIAIDGPYRLQMNEHLIRLPLPSWARAICTTAFPRPQLEDLLGLAMPFSVQEAHAIGTIHELAATQDELLAAATKAAERCATLDPRAFAISRFRARGAEHDRQLAIMRDE